MVTERNPDSFSQHLAYTDFPLYPLENCTNTRNSQTHAVPNVLTYPLLGLSGPIMCTWEFVRMSSASLYNAIQLGLQVPVVCPKCNRLCVYRKGILIFQCARSYITRYEPGAGLEQQS